MYYPITYIWPMTSEHGGKADRGSLWESMYTAWSTHLTTGLACTLSITREYMEHGGRLPANCNLTVYYLPVYPPYSDYNYGLCGFQRQKVERGLLLLIHILCYFLNSIFVSSVHLTSEEFKVIPPRIEPPSLK
jgi:hypothetical protein